MRVIVSLLPDRPTYSCQRDNPIFFRLLPTALPASTHLHGEAGLALVSGMFACRLAVGFNVRADY